MSTPELYRTPEDRFQNLPGYDFSPNYADIDGLRMYYLDVGPRDATPIVCFHGEPTCAYLYRKMIPGLVGSGHRVIVPDYAGFGRSDKPTDRGWYTYDRQVELVTAVLDGLGLRNAAVVVQDWGGPTGLRWAVEHSADVAALTIFNTGLFTGRASKRFLAWREFAEENPDLPVGTILQAGAAQFPLLVPIEEGAVGAAETRAVTDESSRWQKPPLVAFSDADPIFPFPRAGQSFCDLIPSDEAQFRIEGAGQFVQEDRGEQLAVEVSKLLASWDSGSR